MDPIAKMEWAHTMGAYICIFALQASVISDVLWVSDALRHAVGFVLGHFKGQEISEWKYEVVALPKIWMKKFENFYPECLGRIFQIFSFIFWAMQWLHIFILKLPDF